MDPVNWMCLVDCICCFKKNKKNTASLFDLGLLLQYHAFLAIN